MTESKSKTQIHRSKNIRYLRWLLAVTVIYTLYFAQSLIVPLVLTSLVALLLSPLVDFFHKYYVPRGFSAFILLAALITPFTFLGIELVEPVQRWTKLIPELSQHLNKHLETFSESLMTEEQQNAKKVKKEKLKEKSGFNLFGWFSGDDDEGEAVEEVSEEVKVVTERIKQGSTEMLVNLLAAAPIFVGQFFASLVMILFLLIYSPSLFEAFVKSLKTDEDQGHALKLKETIQQQLSNYVIHISLINLSLGLTTALALHLYGMHDALLWGVLVGMLNFIPYLGMLFGTVILSIAGAVQYGIEPIALVPVGIYLTLNLIESQFVTPLLLSNQMQMNPLITILWILICGWLWGITGVLIAVPLLVCLKLSLSQLNIWPQWIKIIEAR